MKLPTEVKILGAGLIVASVLAVVGSALLPEKAPPFTDATSPGAWTAELKPGTPTFSIGEVGPVSFSSGGTEVSEDGYIRRLEDTETKALKDALDRKAAGCDNYESCVYPWIAKDGVLSLPSPGVYITLTNDGYNPYRLSCLKRGSRTFSDLGDAKKAGQACIRDLKEFDLEN